MTSDMAGRKNNCFFLNVATLDIIQKTMMDYKTKRL